MVDVQEADHQMDVSFKLLDAIDRYEADLRTSASLRAGSEDRRREAVQLRRAMANRIAEIGMLGQGCFADFDLHAAFKLEFKSMRTTMADHQASWPIVCIAPEDAAYKASVTGVREANRRLIAWVRNAVRA